MPSIDWPLEQLQAYKPPLTREPDFDAYWKQTVSEAINQPLNAELIPYALPLRGFQCFAVRFDGYKGGRIAGWYLRPDAAGKFPALMHYHGYSGRGARPLDLIQFAQLGICVLSMDCRGQNGQSQDVASYPEGQFQGWMTRGIRDPRSYYYRFVFADAVRALEVLAHREEVDSRRIATLGGSQGGAISLAAASLSDRPMFCLSDVPFLCDYRRAVSIAGAGPYPEIPNFIKCYPHLEAQVYRTLSYCDCMNLTPWIKCRTAVANSLWDNVCPPSTVYAAYNHIAAEKEIVIYRYHGHETPYEHAELRLNLLAEALCR